MEKEIDNRPVIFIDGDSWRQMTDYKPDSGEIVLVIQKGLDDELASHPVSMRFIREYDEHSFIANFGFDDDSLLTVYPSCNFLWRYMCNMPGEK